MNADKVKNQSVQEIKGKNKIKTLERETGIEPATNSLEGCDSTTELLPPCLTATSKLELMIGIEPMTSPLPRECSTN